MCLAIYIPYTHFCEAGQKVQYLESVVGQLQSYLNDYKAENYKLSQELSRVENQAKQYEWDTNEERKQELKLNMKLHKANKYHKHLVGELEVENGQLRQQVQDMQDQIHQFKNQELGIQQQ